MLCDAFCSHTALPRVKGVHQPRYSAVLFLKTNSNSSSSKRRTTTTRRYYMCFVVKLRYGIVLCCAERERTISHESVQCLCFERRSQSRSSSPGFIESPPDIPPDPYDRPKRRTMAS